MNILMQFTEIYYIIDLPNTFFKTCILYATLYIICIDEQQVV